MQLVEHIEEYSYPGYFANGGNTGIESACDLRFYELRNGTFAAVVQSRKGTGVRNRAEALYEQLLKKYDIPPDSLHFVIRYFDVLQRNEEKLEEVRFTWKLIDTGFTPISFKPVIQEYVKTTLEALDE